MPHLDGDILSKILILQSVLKFYVLSREQHSIDMAKGDNLLLIRIKKQGNEGTHIISL